MASLLLLGIIGNIISTVGCVLGNKYLSTAYGFRYMITLSGLHFIFTALGTRMITYSSGQSNNYKKPAVTSVIPLCALSAGSVGFMNLNLLYNSVGFYMLSKLCCIPVTLLLEWALQNKSTSLKLKASLIVVLLGVGIATVTDVQLNWTGSVYAIISVLLTALCQMTTITTKKNLGVNSLQLLNETSPVQSAMYLALAPVFDDWGIALSKFDLLGKGSFFGFEFTPAVLVLILLTCIFGLGVNITNFFVLGETSPITYQVVGHLKTCVILILGFFCFGEEIVLRNVAGIIVALSGMILYSYVKLSEEAAAKKKA
eukprot:TRINITY_DN5628_c0_g1::TRINITY_DN5628_c0_g1_i1::g.12056::m.12056 TRINITY_DN5628_c0_g1::TRINITY_DN5628_c0_g1_i1::g.12056  ORF type:complete len:314 (+),score=44.62,sp/F4IHS9/UXT1_ARATH/39.10/7e-60,TPT/PF03151.11/4.1e+02,TPT/PF03151.11/2.5e-22,EamA/PF00892.15/64,EamA/PF00892.15/72,EamA/PF00892.15/8.2e-05,UAA/PF08449.6/0.0045,EmrE/PF13536.1/5.7e+02,EmrE/PF13536.1/9.7,EmrE/PF13536.1/0.015 TRINITY_DN5628_c0_g1_i1:126-1067(+)